MLDTLRPSDITPLSAGFLRWQVELRRQTMLERNGSPQAGVAPLLSVQRSGRTPSVTTHSIICGLLPAPDQIESKTAEFQKLCEEVSLDGAPSAYDRGIEFLKSFYENPKDFDPYSITTLLGESSPAVVALQVEPRCSLIFYVFDLVDQTEIGRFRCLQLDCRAEIHASGPVYDNVWWHNALFHGNAEGSVVIQFLHRRTFDTRFGELTAIEPR
jgi:hypothetical protein